MTTQTQTTTGSADRRTLIDTGRDYLDSAVQAVKDHPVAAAGIAAGVVAAAAGTAYGVAALRGREAGSSEEDQLIIDPQRVPEELPINGE